MTLQELVKSLVSRFSGDPSAPSVVLSWLEDRQRWYASAVRYIEKFGCGKHVVTKATGDSLEETLGNLACELQPYLSSTGSYQFTVVEDCDHFMEEFGGYLAEKLPAPGDVVTLKWLDGTDAYKVRVVRVFLEDLVLKVRRLKGAEVHTE